MISIKVLDAQENVIAEETNRDEVNLLVKQEYKQGDHILFEVDEKDAFYVISADDAIGESLVYLTSDLCYMIPFDEKKVCYSPKSFSGDRHLIFIRRAYEEETACYRNISENRMDQHGYEGCYPHASANVETRGESVFAARNAIDGITANHSHGQWPYGSWGINQDPCAEIKIDFGREVECNRVMIYSRADFPHDNWWTQATLTFSDNTVHTFKLEKSDQGQRIEFPAKKVSWIKLGSLIKADDPSPFPALTQIKVFGKDII